MAGTRKSMLRPAVIFLIGIVLIAVSFTIWYFIVPPVEGLSSYSISSSSGTNNIASGSSLVLYPVIKVTNVSRPADYYFDLSINVATSGGPVSVTVYERDNTIFSARTNATYKTISCSSAAGSHSVYVSVTNSSGTRAISNVARIAFDSAFAVSVSPSSVVLNASQSQTFTSAVLNDIGPYSYQWYLDNSPVAGAKSSTYTYTQRALGLHSVYVNVTDSTGAHAISNVARITMKSVPYVTISPILADADRNQTFVSTVLGGTNVTGPYSYQWYLDGKPVPGATSSVWNYTVPISTTILSPDVTSPISVSLLDAFTGGITPRIVIQNLNTTSTSVTYSYSYSASYRSSDVLPIAMFVVGAIIAVIEGISLLRFAITRVRER